METSSSIFVNLYSVCSSFRTSQIIHRWANSSIARTSKSLFVAITLLGLTQPGQILLLLLLGAIRIDGMHDQRRLHAHDRTVAAVHAFDFPGDQTVGHVACPRTAVTFPRDRKQIMLMQQIKMESNQIRFMSGNVFGFRKWLPNRKVKCFTEQVCGSLMFTSTKGDYVFTLTFDGWTKDAHLPHFGHYFSVEH